jgi:tRNA modification GTPase
MWDDTIVALATPPGESGIALVRMSGPAALTYAGHIFTPVTPPPAAERPSHSLTLGWLTEASGAVLDQVLLGVMRAPHSYTGEDVVEFNCHGGSQAVRACLRLCLAEGARPAEPGEFTERAFFHDKIDLTQAEALQGLIRAQSEQGLKIAAHQLQGHFREQIAALEDQLIAVDAALIASLDFPEEVGDFDRDGAAASLRQVASVLERLLVSADRGAIYRDGVRLVICGKPNVGKSSLLNRLIEQDKAIITDIPGTTRDIIEERINLNGIPLRLMDTAGLRETGDVVERIGVDKTKEALETADIILFVLDAAAEFTPEDAQAGAAVANFSPRIIRVFNKIDALEQGEIDALTPIRRAEIFFDNWDPSIESALISVQTGAGLEELWAAIARRLLGPGVNEGQELMVNLRQRQALQTCQERVEELQQSLDAASLDCLAIDLQEILDALGEVSGKNLSEDLITRIFRDFCIGK